MAEEIVYHSRKVIDEMIYSLWRHKVGISNIDNEKVDALIPLGNIYARMSKYLLYLMII